MVLLILEKYYLHESLFILHLGLFFRHEGCISLLHPVSPRVSPGGREGEEGRRRLRLLGVCGPAQRQLKRLI